MTAMRAQLPFVARAVLVSLLIPLAGGWSAARAQGSAADAYPQRAVRIIAAQQAGSATDQVARILADFLAVTWKQPVVVDNRPGAGGGIGTQAAARAEPDGYTLLVGGLSNLVTYPELTPDPGFDPESDFIAVGRIAFVPFVLSVHGEVPASSVRELVDLARAKPGQVSFATAGTTAFSAFCLRAIGTATGATFLAVEYRGSSTASLDLIAGRVDARVSELDAVRPYVASGKVRILAVAGNRRSAQLPHVPTLVEEGIAGIDMTPWYGLLVPAGIAPALRERIEAAYALAMQDATVRARLEALGYEPVRDTPGDFARALRQDRRAAREIMRVAGPDVPVRR